MPSTIRASERGNRVGRRQLLDAGEALRDQRISLGMSQLQLAEACGMSRSRYTRIEAGSIESFSIAELARLASVLGLDSVVRLYPGGAPVRDGAQARRLAGLLAHVKRPLRYGVEVVLPQAASVPERRAWDAMLYGHGERTAIELEMRMRDVQAMRRRHELKRRDEPTEHFLLLIADTRHNRRVLAEFAELFADLPRLRPSVVHAALEAGQHPATGLLLI
jgi:transcriptional regulator with XRE-family HTH domain